MTVVALPDILGATIAYLRSVSEVATLSGDRISGALQKTWNMPTYAVWLTAAGGPPPDPYADVLYQRIDVRCYGSTPKNAMDLWRLVHPALVPTRASGNPSSVISANTRIFGYQREGGPTGLIEADSGWPVALATYVATFGAVPVA